MGQPQKHKKNHQTGTPAHNKFKTKRRTRDLDEIDADMKKPDATVRDRASDPDLPGEGRFYCLHCAKHFVSLSAMKDHFRTKGHKRRLKALETEPYTLAEADRAGGMGSYIAPKKRKVTTQEVTEDMEEGGRQAPTNTSNE